VQGDHTVVHHGLHGRPLNVRKMGAAR
jgi:hypothetical protein